MFPDNPAFHATPAIPETGQVNNIESLNASKGEVFENASARETVFTNTALGVTHVEHWDTKPGDTIAGQKVSDFMVQIWNRLKYSSGANFLEHGGPFRGYKIDTWHPNRVVEGGISGHAGLTGPLHTKVNGNYLVDNGYGTPPASGLFGGVYSHEFGHNYHMACQMNWDGKIHFVTSNPIAQIFIDIFRRLRGSDARPPKTNEVERFTEDFKYFFGTNNIALQENQNDDAHNTASGVRWAKDVRGLQQFIRGLWPIFHWLKDKQVRNFTYTETDGVFMWERHLGHGDYRWERFHEGLFFRWDGFNWHPFNKKTRVILNGNFEKWKPTGIRIVKGENITISASGIITFFFANNYPFPPAGELTKRAGNGAPAPGEIANSLVAHAGGRPVYIGSGRTIIADATTELFIAANDDFFPDNGGHWTVDIEI